MLKLFNYTGYMGGTYYAFINPCNIKTVTFQVGSYNPSYTAVIDSDIYLPFFASPDVAIAFVADNLIDPTCP
jgi:hypothetical protein